MDTFTQKRLLHLIESFQSKHGKGISMAEAQKAGIQKSDLKKLESLGLLKKTEVRGPSGGVENRYKIQKNWKELNR